MKKLITMICVVLILTGAVIIEQIIIKTYLSEIKQKTEYIIEISQGQDNIQTQEIIDKVADLKETWIHHETILGMFANHKDMRDLCVEIQKLQGNIEVNQYEDFTAGLKVIAHLTEDYNNLMGINWTNIF